MIANQPKCNLVATANYQQLKARLELTVVGFQWTHPWWSMVKWYDNVALAGAWFLGNDADQVFHEMFFLRCAYVKVLLGFSVGISAFIQHVPSDGISCGHLFFGSVVCVFLYSSWNFLDSEGSMSAMAMNISMELLSGKVCTLEVQPGLTIRELKETVKKASCWTYSCSMLL